MLPPVAARIAYCVYAVVLLITQTLLLAAPGRRVPIYAALGVIASIPVLCDNRKLRLWAVPAIVLVMGLIVYDHQAGIRFQQRVSAIRQVKVTSSEAPIRSDVGHERSWPVVQLDSPANAPNRRRP